VEKASKQTSKFRVENADTPACARTYSERCRP